MSRLAAYSALERLGPVVSTAEAAAALRRTASSTSRLLRGLEEVGRAQQVRAGLWAIGPNRPDIFAIVAELTRPHPAYVSFLSALSYHGMIDQIPREISVASLDRAHRINTNLGTFAIHHLAPELFGGWQETGRGRVATPEKAVFDLSYVSAVHAGAPRRIPELDLPTGFDPKAIDQWVDRIVSARLATLTRVGIDYLLARVDTLIELPTQAE
jgi:predicted transcriptional regulator of viral defense system